jgi:hypothetical protein
MTTARAPRTPPRFARANRPLRRRELLDLWPDPEQAPNSTTLWRFLDRAAENGLLTQTGRGTKNAPFRYALKQKLAG